MIGNLNEQKLGLERLEKLAAHLESGNLGHELFNFNQFHIGPHPIKETRCGTEGCAIGECPFVFPEDWEFCECGQLSVKPRLKSSAGTRYHDSLSDAIDFFHLKGIEARLLFMPFGGEFQEDSLSDKATAAQVAQQIREFITRQPLTTESV